MEILTAEQFFALTQDIHAKILSDSTEGPKVLQQQNGNIIKIFYSSKKWSLPLLLPHALRFHRSAKRLNNANFLAPSIKTLAYYPTKKAHVLTYPEIPGQDFRQLSDNTPAILEKLPRFLAALHQKGIFYKGIHLGNIILTPKQEIALIDITNVKAYHKPLTLPQRAKNLAHFVYYWRDTQVFRTYRRNRFLQEYALAEKLSTQENQKLRHLIAVRLIQTKAKRTKNILAQ